MKGVRSIALIIAAVALAGLVAVWLWVRPFSPAVRLVEVSTPNGVETVNGQTFFWAGGGRTRVTLDARRTPNAELSFVATLGPSLPGVPRRHLLITAAGGFSRVLTIGAGPRVSVVVPVVSGANEIGLVPLDAPTVAVQPNGDRRALLLGVGDLTVGATEKPPAEGEPCYAVLTSGWEPIEQAGADWFRWSGGRGDVLVVVPAAVPAALEGDIISMIRPNAVTLRLNGSAVARWPLEGQGFGAITIPAFALRLGPGQNLLSFVSEAPAVTTPTDPRRLAIAIRNLRVRTGPNAQPCQMTR